MKCITPDFGSNIESKFAADVTRNIEELQKKLILLLCDTLPSQLERENVEYTTEEFDKWLVDIKRSSTTEDVDIKVHTARTVVDKWKMKVKRKLTSEENRSSSNGSQNGDSFDSASMSKYPLSNMYNDISIPVSPLHFTETYTDETNLRRYTGDSFENIELAQEYWDLEAKKLGFFIFWNLKQNDNKIQISESHLEHVFKEYKIKMDSSKIWDILDTDDTMAVDLSECVKFVTDTLSMRRDLSRTILDSKAILRQINLFFTGGMYFIMFFVVLEVYKIARFQNLWQAFSASLIAFSFIFGNSLKEIWENLVYLFTIHAFDVGDIIILADTRYTIKTISLTHVGCTRVDNASFTIPMQSFVGQELNNITRSGCKWEGFSMLVDIETTKDQLSQVAVSLKQHISFNKRHYGGLYRIFFVPTDGLVHKLKMAIYFNYSQNEGDLMLIGVGRTMLHDVVARAMKEAGISFTLPDFSHARKSKSQAREMDHMDYQNYTVVDDRMFNVGLAEL
jgi:small-conductance mechanosensitive channel